MTEKRSVKTLLNSSNWSRACQQSASSERRPGSCLFKTVVDVGEAILGPEPTLDFLFYFRFTPVSLSAALMGSENNFDYENFIYSPLRQFLVIKKKCWHLSFHGYVAGLLTVSPCSTSETQQEVLMSKVLLIYNWQIEEGQSSVMMKWEMTNK